MARRCLLNIATLLATRVSGRAIGEYRRRVPGARDVDSWVGGEEISGLDVDLVDFDGPVIFIREHVYTRNPGHRGIVKEKGLLT